MNVMENYFAITIVAFLSGGFIGIIIYRLFQVDSKKSQRVEQQMDDLQQKHTHYQAQVSEHFLQTAQLFNRLNEDYREIHTHLAQGATVLCKESSANDLLALSAEQPQESVLDVEPEILEDAEVEPPRDYAPKTEEDKGTLAEDFGLKNKTKESTE